MGLKNYIYENTPIYGQNLICSIYGTFLKRKRFSKEFFKYLDWLEESQYWNEQEIYDYKLRELQKIYQHAYATVPFYRHKYKKAGLPLNLIQELDDTHKIPILKKAEIREHWKNMVSQNHPDGKLFSRQTSGSTGTALDFYATKKSTRFQWALWWRLRQQYGVNFGDKSLSFIGKITVPINQKKPPFWRVNKPLNQHLVNMQHIKDENIKYFIDYIDKEHFVFFSGYPSIIYSFCHIVESLGLKIKNPPKFVFSGAEKLFVYQKSCIERVLGCIVTDHYGFSEGAGNATQCKHGNYHEDFEFGHLEPNRANYLTKSIFSGEILATGFANYGMPFIRYNVGDTATWSTEKCACGRNSSTILNIDGRNEDYIITPEGLTMKVHSYLFKDTKEIQECQIVQYKLGEVTFRIVKRQGYTSWNETHLRQKVRKWISSSIAVHFEYVDEIERTDSGKFKAVISYIDINNIKVHID
ncbi:phenylacetate--CoA ligase family protein [Arenibacter sp. S6351L]|uniref:phenylacetate--CoA ligase family protein n=1 Tax=Arenibacter sp. S6351L TaxID=2926407 RepID=UPI001FF4FE40|nr:phenylacetate--CoA ligase family protein [Arenibacter sp. S6351L]MCK0137247.1 phenylacetate--CoA ligase family protein [Arenibacter sp. S6351L]